MVLVTVLFGTILSAHIICTYRNINISYKINPIVAFDHILPFKISNVTVCHKLESSCILGLYFSDNCLKCNIFDNNIVMYVLLHFHLENHCTTDLDCNFFCDQLLGLVVRARVRVVGSVTDMVRITSALIGKAKQVHY